MWILRDASYVVCDRIRMRLWSYDGWSWTHTIPRLSFLRWLALGACLARRVEHSRSARRVPSRRRRGCFTSRFCCLATSCLALRRLRQSAGWAQRFVPSTETLRLVTGLALTIAGCLFAVWARLTLGANWSGRATVKAGPRTGRQRALRARAASHLHRVAAGRCGNSTRRWRMAMCRGLRAGRIRLCVKDALRKSP